MKQQAKKLLKHPLIYGSAIVVLGNLFANFFNFLFNLFMSRNLSVTDYGVLASIVSLLGFPAIFASAITPTVIRFSGSYFASGDLAMIRGLYVKIAKLAFISAAIIFIAYLVFLPQISNFLHIKNHTLLFLADIIIFLILISVINQAFLQAKLAFGFQVLTNTINTALKFILGIVFVYLGFSTLGAAFAILISFFVAYVVSFMPIRFIFNRKIKSPKINSRDLFSYGLPSALTFLGMTSFIASDIILVKHFFEPHAAGIYAGLSLVARIIFYISAPIGTVMFPVIVQKHTRNENFSNTFKLSLVLIFVPSLALTILYYFFPNFFILFFLKNADYLSVASLLGLFSLFITFYSVLSLLALFYLSIKKTIIYIPILIGAILQIILICIYHQTFLQIISISLTLTFLLVIALLVYYPYATKKSLQN